MSLLMVIGMTLGNVWMAYIAGMSWIGLVYICYAIAAFALGMEVINK